MGLQDILVAGKEFFVDRNPMIQVTTQIKCCAGPILVDVKLLNKTQRLPMLKLSKLATFLFLTLFSHQSFAYYGIEKVSIVYGIKKENLSKEPSVELIIQYTDLMSTCNHPNEIQASKILSYKSAAGKIVSYRVNKKIPDEIIAPESVTCIELSIEDFKKAIRTRHKKENMVHTIKIEENTIAFPECFHPTLPYLYKLWDGKDLRLHLVEIEGELTLAAYEIL